MSIIRQISRRLVLPGVLLACAILVWRIWAVFNPFGIDATGERTDSPNGLYEASAREHWREDFWGYRHHWFVLEVKGKGAKQPIHRLVLDSIPGPYMYFGSRANNQVVFWDAASTEVRFVFPAAQFVLKPGVQ